MKFSKLDPGERGRVASSDRTFVRTYNYRDIDGDEFNAVWLSPPEKAGEIVQIDADVRVTRLQTQGDAVPDSKTPTPGPIPPGDSKNYDTILRACKNGSLCLMSAVRKSDGKRVSLICAINPPDGDGQYAFAPLAVMVEGNPFEDFCDPTAV